MIKKIHTIKRINNEIVELFSKYKNISVHYTEEIIRIKIENIEFHANNQYPFHPPTIYINQTPYSQYLITKSPRIIKILRKYTREHCVCCSTIICPANWTATYHIQKILDEIQYINELKRIVKYEIAVMNLYDREKNALTPFLTEDICNIILTYLI